MKNLICKLGFTIIVLFLSCALFSQEDAQYIVDSLSTRIKDMTGQPRLEALAKLAQSEIYSDNLIAIVDNLQRESIKQENDRFLLCSYNYRITYYLRSYNQDSISKYMKLSVPIQRKLDPTDDFVVRNELLKNIVYTERGLFDLALINQKKYLERIENINDIEPELLRAVYIGFGNIYYHQEQYEEALKYFNQAKDLAQTIVPSPISDVSTLCLITLCEVNIENYTKAIQCCDSVINIINENEENIAAESRTSLKDYTNLIAIQAHSKLKNFKKAKILIEQLLGNLDSPIYQEPEAYCYRSLSIYYSETHQYNEALKYTKLGIEHLKKNNNIIALPAFIKEKAFLYYNNENYKEAFNELLYSTQLTDSIRNSQNAIQLDELAVMYDVNFKDAEIAKTNTQLKLTRTINIALIGGFILLFSLLLIIRMNSKKQKAKNKILFKQQEALNKSINYYKKIIVEEINIDSSSNSNPLFLKLESYMLDEKAYRDPNITREDIISALNTNRQYLSVAIKEATGLTLVGYINKCRLENARKLLLENKGMSIDDIILKAGFSSRPTFYRLFKEQYGMPPNELKQIAVTVQNKIKEEEKEDL